MTVDFHTLAGLNNDFNTTFVKQNVFTILFDQGTHSLSIWVEWNNCQNLLLFYGCVFFVVLWSSISDEFQEGQLCGWSFRFRIKRSFSIKSECIKYKVFILHWLQAFFKLRSFLQFSVPHFNNKHLILS